MCDLSTATVEVGELDQLVTLTGASSADPIHDIAFENLSFERTHRTLFNSPFVNLSRGDWSVVAKGAASVKNSRNVTFTSSSFTDLGGNGIFLEGYNSGTEITASRFENNGATDIQVVGSPNAVRNYADNYFTTPRISDLGSGPKTEDYPRDVLIEGNVMRNNGRYEKQTSSVNIAMALDITVRGNSLSDSPRACLNFSDNTWGGHLIQDNDIFDCVRETGDNGSINSWGRSRFWKTGAANDAFASLADGVTFMGNTGGPLTAEQARAMMKLDVVKPITIDHNRFWHGGDWAIDLDDGSSNFVMTNNVLLKGGVKLRDGFDRTLRNNLILDGATFEQVSYMPGGDVIEQNITLGRLPYDNVLNDTARAQYAIGKNLFWNAGAAIDVKPRGGTTEKLSADGATINTASSWYTAGMDRDSKVGDPAFSAADPTGDYDFTVAGTSPALALGFQNIPMTGFGAADGALPPRAVLPTGTTGPDPIELAHRKYVEKLWGGNIANITTTAEQSSYAISDFKGVKFVSVPGGSLAATAGLRTDDLIRTVNGTEVTEQRNSFWQAYNALPAGSSITLGVRRASTNVTVELAKPTDARDPQQHLRRHLPDRRSPHSGVVDLARRIAGRGGRLAGRHRRDAESRRLVGADVQRDRNRPHLSDQQRPRRRRHHARRRALHDAVLLQRHTDAPADGALDQRPGSRRSHDHRHDEIGQLHDRRCVHHPPGGRGRRGADDHAHGIAGQAGDRLVHGRRYCHRGSDRRPR